MSLMGLGALSTLDAAIWWLSPGDRDSWPVLVSNLNLPSGDVRFDDARHFVYWSKSFYDSVTASLAAIGRSLSTQAPPDKSQVAPDVSPLFVSLGKAGDVRTAIQLALANPGKPLPPPAPAPAPTPAPVSVPAPAPAPVTPSATPSAPVATTPPVPTSTPPRAPATQITPASAANAIVQSGTPSTPAVDQTTQYSATTAIKPPSSAVRWVLLGVLALGGLGGGTYYFIKKRKAAKHA